MEKSYSVSINDFETVKIPSVQVERQPENTVSIVLPTRKISKGFQIICFIVPLLFSAFIFGFFANRYFS